jgi:hypothetical protein
METQKYGIRNKVRSLARTGILALALAAAVPAYCQNSLPIVNAKEIASTLYSNAARMAESIKQHKIAEDEKERAVYEPEIRRFQAKLGQVDEYFDECLKDGNLTIKEQKELFRRFDEAEGNMNNFVYTHAKDDTADRKGSKTSRYATKTCDSYGKGYQWNYHFHDERFNLSEKESKLRALIDHNLYGVDAGTPELEKELNKEFSKYGVEIKVENRASPLELGLVGLGGLLFFRKVKNLLKATMPN